MSIQSLIADPDFEKLTPQEKQGALAAIDPEFKNIGVGEVNSVVEGIRGPSLKQRAWEALRIPEQTALQIMKPSTPMTSLEPDVSPSVGKTLLTGIPRVMEETGRTIGNAVEKLSPPKPAGMVEDMVYSPEQLAGTVSRGSMLTAGALKGLQLAAPLIKSTGQGLAKGAEAISGLEHKTPGVLTEAAETAYKGKPLMFQPGKEAASAMYNTGKQTISEPFADMIEPKDIFEKGVALIRKGQNDGVNEVLEPGNALKFRKAIDSLIQKGYEPDELLKYRKIADEMAKGSPDIKAADAVFNTGRKAEALRSFLPLNKTGGASTFKTMMGAALKGTVTLGAMSPIVQGGAATGIGLAGKAVVPMVNNPAVSGAILGNPEIQRSAGLALALANRAKKKFSQ